MDESKQARLRFFVFFTSFLLYWHPAHIRAKKLDQAIEFDYRTGSAKGPERWGELKKEWVACKNGKLQSPIGISDGDSTKIIPSINDFEIIYKPSDATMKNEGHYIAIEWKGDAGSIRVNGTDYLLKKCHWHTPSEHSINGKRYDLELHMFHQNPKIKNVAVVAFLFNIGNPNPFLSKVNEGLKSLINTKNVELGVTDPSEISWTSSKFYRYIGSLTTPPCTEGVIWTINDKVNTVSREQVELLKQAVYDYAVANARPLQPLNNRDIVLFGH